MTQQIPLVDLKAQYAELEPEVGEAMARVLRRADFILGEDVQEFEREFAAYCGTAHAVALDSGISALELGLRALGVGPGDEVITPANSFIASSSAVSFVGAQPVWIDCRPDTYNLDPEQLRRLVTPRTRAIMPVHLYGRPAAMAAVLAVAEEFGLPVLEDACQAHGARTRGRRVGSLGRAAAFSFYPGKNLGAYGDAGCLTTDDGGLAEQVRTMRNYGQRQKYDHQTLAWNRRMDTLQAAVLRVKLRRLDGWNQARRRVASLYDELLAGLPLTLPVSEPEVEHVHHLYVVQTAERDALLAHLHSRGVGAGIHYPIPIHLQAAYAERGMGPGSFPVTEALAPRLLSLPIYPELTEQQVGAVVGSLRDFAFSAAAPA